MPLRTIFAPVIGGDASRPAVESAFFLASLYDAHVSGLHVRPDPRSAIPYVGEGMTADVIEELCDAAERDGKNNAQEARQLFEAIAASNEVSIAEKAETGLSATWMEKVGDEVELTAARARLSDIALVPRPDRDFNKNILNIIEGVLLHSGRPNLLVPVDHQVSENRNVLIAWNGSTESARAVSGAMPVLKSAETVIVLTVGEVTMGWPDPDDVVDYLRLHGIKAQTRQSEDGGKEVGAAILKEAHDMEAGMIVSGAYSHSRWRELVLGGVTRYLLENTNLPTLLVH